MPKITLTALCLLTHLLGLSLPAIAQPDTQTLSQALNGIKIESVDKTPINGLYEAVADGHTFYISEDGRYAIQGEIIDLVKRENITATRGNALRKQTIDQIPENKMVIFEPKLAKHTVTIFTDIDCGYCRKMHLEMADYLAAGIRVRYLAFPRTGPNTPSADKLIHVWCATDRQAAMTAAKTDETVAAATCDNPVTEQFNIGVKLGVTGTPAMVLEDGTLLPGYRPAAELAKLLEQVSNKQTPATEPVTPTAPAIN